MWSNLLNQLQDRIDGAVEMLQEDDGVPDEGYEEEYEEGEYAEEEATHIAKVAGPSSSGAVEVAAETAGSLRQNHGPTPTPGPEEERVGAGISQDVPSASPAPVVDEARGGGWSSEPDVALDGGVAGQLLAKTTAAGEPETDRVAASTPLVGTSSPPPTPPTPPTIDSVVPPPLPNEMRVPGSEGLSPKAVEGVALAGQEEPESPLVASPLPSTHVDSIPTTERQTGCVEPVPGAVVPLTPSSPGGGKEAADMHAQLLRFQQQLAVEMSSGATLAEANTALASRLAEVEAALESAQRTIAATTDSSEAVSTLIDKLGREKERSKHIVEERNKLREEVAELGGLVEDYRAKEAHWLSSHSAQAQSQSSAQAHIAQLETDLQRRTTQVEELEARLAETERARALLSVQLQDSRKQHESAVEQMREASSESLEHAEREVERLRAALRRGSAEYDVRILGMEQELREAITRAHQAEERLSDLERGSIGSLGDLRNELEHLQARVSSLTAELNGVRSENEELLERYGSLKRARAGEEASYKEKLSAHANAVAALTEERNTLAKALSAAKAQAQSADRELTDLRRRCMILEAAANQAKGSASLFAQPPSGLPSDAADTRTGGGDNPFAGSSLLHVDDGGAEHRTSEPATPASSSTTVTTLSRGGPGTGSAVRAPPFFPASPFAFGGAGGGDLATPGSGLNISGSGSGADLFGAAARGGSGVSGRTRLEREMVRQAVEIERLKKTEAEAVALRAKLKDLESQHDLMLQLYGQMEEDLKSAQERARSAKVPEEAPDP